MRSVRIWVNLCIIVFAAGLMGQAQNCGDLSNLMPQLDKLFGSGGKGGKVYISNLSFLDVDSKSVMGAGDAELINAAVEEGMKKLAAQEPKYVVNEPGHTLANSDANAKKLSDIYWEPNFSKAEKVDKIINELMNPNGIDGLVFGQFQQKPDGSVSLRPIVISKSTKNIVTESRTFKKEEFDCTDPNNANKKVLCVKAVEDIRDTVIRLLKTL
jgi:hypothetical protein